MLSFAFLNSDFFMAAGTLVDGNVLVKKNACIAGNINGDIRSTGKIIIQKTAIIHGHVHAKTAIIKGLVKGNIYCEDKVYVQEQASVQGNIFAAEAVIDKNSFIKGTISKLAANEHKQENAEPDYIVADNIPEVSKMIIATEDKIKSEGPVSNWF